MHPIKSPLFDSCQLRTTQAPRLYSIPAKPLSVQTIQKPFVQGITWKTIFLPSIDYCENQRLVISMIDSLSEKHYFKF